MGAPVSMTSAPVGQTVGGVHRHRSEAVIPEMLLHFEDQELVPVGRDVTGLFLWGGPRRGDAP